MSRTTCGATAEVENAIFLPSHSTFEEIKGRKISIVNVLIFVGRMNEDASVD